MSCHRHALPLFLSVAFVAAFGCGGGTGCADRDGAPADGGADVAAVEAGTADGGEIDAAPRPPQKPVARFAPLDNMPPVHEVRGYQ